MITSMTGFAAARSETRLGVLRVELRSLNHRYCEIGVRLPEELRPAESALRERIADRVRRGKLDVTVRFEPAAGGAGAPVELNQHHARQLAQAARAAREIFPDAAPGDLPSWLALPGMISEPQLDLAPLHEALLALVDSALDELMAFRRREGDKLAAVIRERLAEVGVIASRVRDWLPEINERLRARARDRIQQLVDAPLDEHRLEQEVAFLLQRADIDEELDRLTMHLGEVERTLQSDKPVGRRLDFLMQELNREANTLGSKSSDPRTSQASVDLKVLIEQMREQVQNIE